MEFIIEHQAHFAAQTDQLREEDGRLCQATLTPALLRIAGLIEDVGEAQKRTDERLSTLMSVVEQHISRGDGHRPPA